MTIIRSSIITNAVYNINSSITGEPGSTPNKIPVSQYEYDSLYKDLEDMTTTHQFLVWDGVSTVQSTTTPSMQLSSAADVSNSVFDFYSGSQLNMVNLWIEQYDSIYEYVKSLPLDTVINITIEKNGVSASFLNLHIVEKKDFFQQPSSYYNILTPVNGMELSFLNPDASSILNAFSTFLADAETNYLGGFNVTVEVPETQIKAALVVVASISEPVTFSAYDPNIYVMDFSTDTANWLSEHATYVSAVSSSTNPVSFGQFTVSVAAADAVLTYALIFDGKVILTSVVDPTVFRVETIINGVQQVIPVGSVVKNSVSGQKFLKAAGGAKQFVAIETAPKSTWGWSSEAASAWSVLQSL